MRPVVTMAAMATFAATTFLLVAARPVPLPDGAVILPVGETEALLHQCSRATPAPFQGTWQPQPADIARLEAILPKAIISEQPRGGRFRMNAFSPTNWNRQYVGLVRQGRLYIYGNYFPANTDREADMRWRTEPWIVCDGGPNFFGVEYDVRAGRITQITFNGFA